MRFSKSSSERLSRSAAFAMPAVPNNAKDTAVPSSAFVVALIVISLSPDKLIIKTVYLVWIAEALLTHAIRHI